MLNHAGLKWRVVSSHPVILNVITLNSIFIRMVTTAQILAERAMQLPCGEKCVDWAIRLLESGHESQSAYRLAAKLRPHNHFELASLRDQVLTELNLADTADVVAICSYVAEILANSNENTLDAVLTEIKDIYLSNDHEPIEIYDFYLLYFARADLKEQEFQYYWSDATRDNIERITNDRIREFIVEHGGSAT
mgnify:CR=1 FL=1